MAPVIPNPRRIKPFASGDAFYEWLSKHHDKEPEIWIKMHKKGSGLASITWVEAVDVALCWGWIDGIRKSLDERSFLQRYTPRGPKSTWSQINRDNVARLVAAGRMTPHGLRHVEAAKADGRWAKAHAPMRETSEATLPEDLRAAIRANARAEKTFATLNKANLFSLAYRINKLKTEAARTRKVAELVAMLARGETLLPLPAKRK
jgi:uncharacterized protein YdeI (YjbR/CyaY-like superfamily)